MQAVIKPASLDQRLIKIFWRQEVYLMKTRFKSSYQQQITTLIVSTLFALIPISSSAYELPLSYTNNSQQQAASGWLGIKPEHLPNALRAQLSHIIPTGQGILVTSVTAGSPADKAGIQENDILLSFNGQRLSTKQQLSQLVKQSTIGRTIDMDIIHQGRLENRSVTLVARTPSNQSPQPFWQNIPQAPNANKPSNKPLAWDNFESVQVRTLTDGRYHAEVSYKDQYNEEKRFVFEGKKQEIIEQIQQQKHLPSDKKQALLNALNMNPNGLFGSNLFSGFGQSLLSDDFFKQPFFQNNPLNDPAFQQNLQDSVSPLLDQFMQEFNQQLDQYRQAPTQSTPKQPETITL